VQRRDVVAGLVAVLVAAVCVKLGVWQLDRLGQRKARNAAMATRLALPALEVRAGMSSDSASLRQVIARGRYDFAAERTWPGRSYQGTPGVALITPLHLADGSAVLVDRGWAPSPDAFHVDHAAFRELDTATVTGVARVLPRGRGDVDSGGAAGAAGAGGALPFVIELQNPEPPSGLPRRWPPPSFGNGPHLSYAIQWFSFALIALVGTAVLIRRGR
jgi:surfeit locus 1 family protein